LTGDHAGRRRHFASLDVELAIVKIALDDLTLDEPFRKRARAVGAGIVGHEELAIQIENRKHETRFVDLERVAGRHLGGAAQINADSLLADGRQRTSLCRADADPIRDHPNMDAGETRPFLPISIRRKLLH
jgi:hypothetical protein